MEQGLVRVEGLVQVCVGPGNCQSPVSTYAFKFREHVMARTLVATNVHFHHIVAKRGDQSPYVAATWTTIGEHMKKHGSHFLAGDFNQAFSIVEDRMAEEGVILKAAGSNDDCVGLWTTQRCTEELGKRQDSFFRNDNLLRSLQCRTYPVGPARLQKPF